MKGALLRTAWPLAIAPFVLCAFGSRALVSRMANAMVGPLTEAASLVSARTRGTVAEGPRPRTIARVDEVGVQPIGEGNGADPRAPHAPGRVHAGTGVRRGGAGARLFIPSNRLIDLSAAQLGGVGWGRAGEGQGAAPGVRLSGVEGLGVGLADGDVVTSIDGRPTRTEAEATAAGLAAWTSGEPAVHATLLRRDQVVVVTVQLPLGGRRPRPAAFPSSPPSQ